MFVSRLRAENFRNIAFADLDFAGARRIFFVGKNGQGKTNLLEALSLLTALRSFRTRDLRLLVRRGTKRAGAFFELAHEREGATELTLALFPNGSKTVELGAGTPVRRLSEFVGRFPVVVFSSEDISLLRGAPSLRRRWFDLTFSSVNAGYFRALQAYHRALDARNRLLKAPRAEDAQLEAFEKILAENGARLVAARARETHRIAELFAEAAAQISQCADEAPELAYEASIDIPEKTAASPENSVPAETVPAAETVSAWREIFRRSRAQDRLLRATQKGPHRDDFRFNLFGRAATDFASDGQLRGLALSLGLAQLALFRERLCVAPVVLADDVLGELDAARKAGFWRAVDSEIQLFATGTLPPADAASWKIFSVEEGKYRTQA